MKIHLHFPQQWEQQKHKKLKEDMPPIYEYVQDRVRAAKESKNNPANVSAADEILKFKQLLDSGIITQEEYESKKKQLLGV